MLANPPIWLILIAFLAAIGPLVFFHELGHYSVARLFNVKIEAFSIGFGREIFGWTNWLGTRWKIGWLPLGGYVRFAGDMNAASQPSHEHSDDPNLFQNKPVWQRFLIVLAGPVANFILAIAIFAAFFMAVGALQMNSRIGEIEPGSAAERMGIQTGDVIQSIAGRSTSQFEDVTMTVSLRPNESVEVVVKRGEQIIVMEGQLAEVVETDDFGQEIRKGRLGVRPAEVEFSRLGPIDAVSEATGQVVGLTKWMVDGVGQIVTGKRSIKELGGPVKIAQISGQALTLGLYSFVGLVALLSINLGFINLLPVPMLDGGHLAFYTIEAVRRRPLGERAQEWAFRGGLALLLGLFLFLTLNDLVNIGLLERLGRLIG